MRAKINYSGNLRACTSLPVGFIWDTEPFFSHYILEGGRGGKKRKAKLFPVFRSQIKLENKKLRKPFPAQDLHIQRFYAAAIFCQNCTLKFSMVLSAWSTYSNRRKHTFTSVLHHSFKNEHTGKHRLLSPPPEYPIQRPNSMALLSVASKGWAWLHDYSE